MTQQQADILPLECSAATGAVSFTGSNTGKTLLDFVGEVGCLNDFLRNKHEIITLFLKNEQLLFIEGDDRNHQEHRNAWKKADDILYHIVQNRQYVNSSMAPYVALAISEPTDKNYYCIKGTGTLNLGITYTENYYHVRNTKALEGINQIKSFGPNLTIPDHWISTNKVKHKYNLETRKELPKDKFDVIVLTVAHKVFLNLNCNSLLELEGIQYDVKGILTENVNGRL